MLLSDVDLYLFGEGTHRRLWEMLGAHPAPDGGVGFAVWAPNASAVYAVGDWNGWGDGTALQPQGDSGIWAGVCPDAAPGHRYKLAVVSVSGDTVLKADPMARSSECPPANASRVPYPSGHQWSDGDWMSGRSADAGRRTRDESRLAFEIDDPQRITLTQINDIFEHIGLAPRFVGHAPKEMKQGNVTEKLVD